MNIEHLFRSLKAQAQQIAPLSTPADTSPSAAPPTVAAKIAPIPIHDTLVNRWPIFQSHALTTWEAPAPLSDEEKMNRLTLTEPTSLPLPAAAQFTPDLDTDIAGALRKLDQDLYATATPDAASGLGVDNVETFLGETIVIESAVVESTILEVEPARTEVTVAAFTCGSGVVANGASTIAKDTSLGALFDRISGRPTSPTTPPSRRRSFASIRMRGR